MSALENRARGTDILAGSGILTGISPDVGERKQEINLYIKRLPRRNGCARRYARLTGVTFCGGDFLRRTTISIGKGRNNCGTLRGTAADRSLTA